MAHDILIVDDEEDIRHLVSGILEDEGYKTRTASDGLSALDMIRSRQPSLIVLDVWLGASDRDGLRILEIIKKDHPYVPVVMISGHGTIETAVIAIKNGAYDFIEKPFSSKKLLITVQRAMESAKLRRDNETLKLKARQSSPLVGISPSMVGLRQTVERISPTNGRVFISSSFGFDRESLARDIHERSRRNDGPFWAMNCSMFPSTLIEAELFGVEVTLSSGDSESRLGIMERAHTGTLFLDEITALPLSAQMRLVKVLHEGSFCRLGGQKKIDVDLRIIAGSSQNVSEKIKAGEFKDDLFYRLSVSHLEVLPLAERKVDVPILVEHYVQQSSLVHNLSPRRISEEAMIMLQSYPWIGDTEQLKNVADWLVIMAEGDICDPITPDQLPPEILSGNSFVTQWQKKTADIVILPLREAREAFEREYLSTQVNRFSGNISRTARFIGMERSALHRKLKALGITDPRGEEEAIQVS